jgi:hypothetical protein
MNSEQQFDDAIRAKLREVAVPVGLKTRILANVKPARSVNLWAWLAPAAAVAAALAVVLLWPHPGNSFAAYRGEMVKFVSVEYKLDFHVETLAEVRQAMAQHSYPADYIEPPGLKQLRVEGGCLRQWRGRKVSLICMEARDHDVWMFVTEALPDAPTEPVFTKTGRITSASWTSGQLTYILATEGDEAELRSYL